MKSLTLAQKSTGSMGKFDKRLKREPEPQNSQQIVKKKSSRALFELESNRANEKSRNMKVLDVMQRKKEIELGGKVNGNMVGAAQKQAKIKSAAAKGKKRKIGKKN